MVLTSSLLISMVVTEISVAEMYCVYHYLCSVMSLQLYVANHVVLLISASALRFVCIRFGDIAFRHQFLFDMI